MTFDCQGISGHPNHISLYKSIPTLRSRHPTLRYYSLRTVPLLRKYISLLDLPLSIMLREGRFFTSSPFLAQSAMEAHWSQYVWFRRVWIVISRYMVMNEIVEVL